MREKQWKDTAERLPELTRLIRTKKSIIILTHDNPDPDSLASAYGLLFLFRRRSRAQIVIAYGGVIGRAENRAMVRELRIPLIHLSKIDLHEYDCIVLVDHQIRKGVESLVKSACCVVIIDHHPILRGTSGFSYLDVRKGFGANSTVIAQYLAAASIRISSSVASALIHGIRTDTLNFSRGAGASDLEAYLWLFPFADHIKLQNILHPIVEPEYLRNYWSGIQNAWLQKEIITTYAGSVISPDLPADIADRLIAIRGVKFALACGLHDGVLHLSVRCRNTRKDAGWLIQKVIGSSGTAGGHGYMAGGQVCVGFDAKEIVDIVDKLSRRFVSLIHQPKKTPSKPVSLIESIPIE